MAIIPKQNSWNLGFFLNNDIRKNFVKPGRKKTRIEKVYSIITFHPLPFDFLYNVQKTRTDIQMYHNIFLFCKFRGILATPSLHTHTHTHPLHWLLVTLLVSIWNFWIRVKYPNHSKLRRNILFQKYSLDNVKSMI